MIVLEREVPIIIPILEALLNRLPSDHPKLPEIVRNLGSFKAGYMGEKSLDYYFSFLPDDDYLILHGLRLPFKNHYFQIDTLLLSKNFFLIIESKNNSGTLMHNHQFNQLIRMKDGEEEVLKNPYQQVRLQQYQFVAFLKMIKFTPIPIEHLVIMTNPRVLLKSTDPHSDFVKKVITNPRLIEKVADMKHKHSKERVSIKELRKLSKQLIKAHTPLFPDVFKTYEIKKSELITGVQCPSCNRYPMKRLHGKWICQNCNFPSKDAHIKALKDYALLFKQSISNQETRDYLKLDSRTTSYKILHSLNLPISGPKQNRKYLLSVKKLD